MNLYLISQDVYTGYDTFDSAVVAADSEDEAQRVQPSGPGYSYGWPEDHKVVKVRLIGIAQPDVERGVVCASFNAG